MLCSYKNEQILLTKTNEFIYCPFSQTTYFLHWHTSSIVLKASGCRRIQNPFVSTTGRLHWIILGCFENVCPGGISTLVWRATSFKQIWDISWVRKKFIADLADIGLRRLTAWSLTVCVDLALSCWRMTNNLCVPSWWSRGVLSVGSRSSRCWLFAFLWKPLNNHLQINTLRLNKTNVVLSHLSWRLMMLPR